MRSSGQEISDVIPPSTHLRSVLSYTLTIRLVSGWKALNLVSEQS
jgi:hypothetical protein